MMTIQMLNRYDLEEWVDTCLIPNLCTQSGIKLKEFELTDDIHDMLCDEIDNEVTFNHDCFSIVFALKPIDFMDEETGEYPKNIQQLAYNTLYRFALDRINDYIAEGK